MTPMTTRERILRAIHHQEADRIPLVDSAWAGTVARWRREGLPESVAWEDYFGYDRVINVGVDNSPRFESRVIEKTDRYSIITTGWGQTLRVFNELDSTPEVLDSYYSDPVRWEEAKERMWKELDTRIPWELLKQNYDGWRANGEFLRMGFWFGFDVTHSHMAGTETVLCAMYEDPEWVQDMFDTYLSLDIELFNRIWEAGYRFDSVHWPDDMGYKGSTFFSPAMYRELLKPYHKRAVDWAHDHSMVVELHSCGFIQPLVPDLVEIGIDCLNPLEIKAGMDPVYLKKTFGNRLAFHGGINAQLWDKIDLVTTEMERIIPLLKEGGGYIFASDHSIPNSVSFENMKIISELAHKLGKY
ncbi:MAG: hypothetical protein J6K29_07600 [Clostridia bacterium]|nr:hypothetical protein [Clostridia bacterium]